MATWNDESITFLTRQVAAIERKGHNFHQYSGMVA